MPRPSALALFVIVPMLPGCGTGDAPDEPGDAASHAASGQTQAVPATATDAAGRPAASRQPASIAPQAQDADDRCRASLVRGRWLNALPSAEVKAAIADAVGERTIRYYAEGDPVTMDFSEDRLNVVLGKDGRIKEFACG